MLVSLCVFAWQSCSLHVCTLTLSSESTRFERERRDMHQAPLSPLSKDSRKGALSDAGPCIRPMTCRTRL